MSVRVESFSNRDLSDDRVEAIVALRRLRWREFRPEDTEPRPEVLDASTRQWSPSNWIGQIALAWDGDRPVGYADYDIDPDDNPTLVWLSAYVIPPRRHEGVARALMRPLLAGAHAAGGRKATFALQDHVEIGATLRPHVEEDWGLEVSMVEREARLDLDDVDPAVLADLAERYRRQMPDVKFTFFRMDELPGPETGFDFLNFLDMVEEIENLMPREGLELGDERYTEARFRDAVDRMRGQGREIWNVVAQDRETGAALGITNVGVDPLQPEIVAQWDTGVRRAHWGRGIATALKADMLQRLLQGLPGARFMDTENAHSNDAMIAINSKLGFKEHRRTYYYQLPLEALNNRMEGQELT